MRITGLSVPDQNADIHVVVEGQIVSAMALLSEPRLHLLSVHPIGLSPTGGEASATVELHFPLEHKLRIDDVQIQTTARLAHVRVANVAGGRELDGGSFDLTVDKDGLGLKGRAALAKIPVSLDATMDFSPGPDDQIVQKITLTGQPDAAQLDAAGLRVSDVVNGQIPMNAVMIERRDGSGTVSLGGDFTLASLQLAPLGWSKPSGIVANGSATLVMTRDRLTKINRIAVQGDGIAVSGSANLTDGRVRSVTLDAVRLGRTQGHGTILIGGALGAGASGGGRGCVEWGVPVGVGRRRCRAGRRISWISCCRAGRSIWRGNWRRRAGGGSAAGDDAGVAAGCAV